MRKVIREELQKLKEAFQKAMNTKKKQPQVALLPYRDKKIFS